MNAPTLSDLLREISALSAKIERNEFASLANDASLGTGRDAHLRAEIAKDRAKLCSALGYARQGRAQVAFATLTTLN